MTRGADDLTFPETLGYVPETHEWAHLDGNICTVGISDYAQREIGDVVYVELPEVGSHVTAESEFGVIESVKSAFDLYAPMSGEVIEVNGALDEHPELVNEDCYGSGWMIRIRVTDAGEFKRLLSANDYREAIENA
jgi:glycine cleavage system H protein